MQEKLGTKFIRFRIQLFEKSYEETDASTPVFFILSPGVDPLKVRFLIKGRFDFNHKYSIYKVDLISHRIIFGCEHPSKYSLMRLIRN